MTLCTLNTKDFKFIPDLICTSNGLYERNLPCQFCTGSIKTTPLKPLINVLTAMPRLSYGDPDNRNLLIQGDNLEALKTLIPFYAGQVKCIY